MAAYTVYGTDLTGDSKAYVTPANGDTFPNDGHTILHVKNGNAGICTVTINSVKPCDQGADHDIVVAVAATTGDEMIGPFPVSRFGGTVTVISYSVTATVSVAAISVPQA